MIGIGSHFRAGSGAIAVEGRDETRLVREIINELPAGTAVFSVAAPSGEIKDVRTGRVQDGSKGLLDGYKWASAAPGRCLIVFDFHCLINNPGHWRSLLEALPALRTPKGSSKSDPASLVVFVGPTWEIEPRNPIKGGLPILQFDPPDREALGKVAESLRKLGDEREGVIDALCGLSADAAEQAAAEVIARGKGWDVTALRGARRQALKEAGLELREPISADDYGGMGQLKADLLTRVVPWLRDERLSVRRLCFAGTHGSGKTLGAQLLAGMLNCEAVVLSLSKLKAGIVGASEANLSRAFRTISAMGKHSPLVVVIDEVDTIAKSGLDGGTSAGMWSILGEHLQYDKSCTVFIGTTNRYDLLDTALTQRFGRGYFFNLPGSMERKSICEIHYRRCGAKDPEKAAKATSQLTEGYSARELAESIVPDVVASAGREKTPETDLIRSIIGQYTPTSVSQADQLAAVRKSASALRKANDCDDAEPVKARRVANN